MNNEKQHSEYKIIETVATPTFDGVSVETHPEDLLGGGDTPEKTLWKTKADTYGYIFCEIRGNDVMILSKNSQGDLPYVLENGNVFSFTSKTDAQIKTLLVDPLNAKGYNLPSSGWLEEITTLKRGDSVPNWNEYQEL